MVIVGKKAIPADDIDHLIAWLKANPVKASAGILGVGNIGHVGGILFQKITNSSCLIAARPRPSWIW